MFKFGKTKVAKVKFYGSEKLAKIWDVDVDKMFISKAIKTKNSSKYLIFKWHFKTISFDIT